MQKQRGIDVALLVDKEHVISASMDSAPDIDRLGVLANVRTVLGASSDISACPAPPHALPRAPRPLLLCRLPSRTPTMRPWLATLPSAHPLPVALAKDSVTKIFIDSPPHSRLGVWRVHDSALVVQMRVGSHSKRTLASVERAAHALEKGAIARRWGGVGQIHTHPRSHDLPPAVRLLLSNLSTNRL